MEASRRRQEKLFLHRNTIKYRLQRITDMLGHHPAKMPEMMGLYRSAAVYRLLVASKEHRTG